MSKRFSTVIASTIALLMGVPGAGMAQNLLQDGGFDGASGLSDGNNRHDLLPDWRFAEVVSPTVVFKNAHNIVQVDGPGGFDYLSSSGDILGPESDASGSPAGTAQHYIDSGNQKSLAWQYFTPQCSGTATGYAFFTNREGHGYPGGTLSGAQLSTVPSGAYYRTYGGVSIIPAPVQIGQFPGGPAQVPAADRQAVIDLEAAHDAAKFRFLLGAGDSRNYPWTSFSTQAQVQAGQTYAFVAELGSSVNMDNATVLMDCTTATPAGDVTLYKSCTLAGPHNHNGVLGQRWECQVDVTAANAPFAGDIVLHDVFTDTGLVEGQILLGESVSGNGSCFQGDCQIFGADFDSSGVESFTFDIFVDAIAPADVYPLENCVTGELTDDAGATTALTPHCTTGQWIPRVEVVKSCDPIAPDATAPFTLNCQIQVTASGLVAGTYVTVMDAFAALPPTIATVQPTFMNVTSPENWDCIDHALNSPGSIGLCELPAEDLMAAGGSSTLDISFQFDVDQVPTQVANCRFGDIHDGSYLEKLRGERGALRSPIPSGAAPDSGWPQMPDGCVYVDVPGRDLPAKVETRITKDCDQPTLTQLDGTWGYLWQCEAEIEVTPAPFAGEVSFTDDGSQISLGTAEFVSVSDPNCSGLGTGTLDCTFQGPGFSSPHVVQYDLFTPYSQTDAEIEWKNCIRGAATTPAGSFPSVPMCTGRTIKPGDGPDFPEPKEIKLTKQCEDSARDMEHDGVAGFGWDCKIIIEADPAPFAGSFTFTEDASAITGSAGQIIGIDQPQPADWACTPNVPTSTTDCTILGTAFDPSGSETLGFTLFAPRSDKPIDWRNCVSGVYTPAEGGEPREIGGNCQEISWEPTDDVKAEFDIEKTCKPEGDRTVMGPNAWFQTWSCTITVTSNGVPFNDTLWVDEDMLYGPHDGSQSIVSITSGDPWQCTPAPYGPNGNQPACAIQGSQFPHNASTLDVTLNIFGGAADPFGAQNCVSLILGSELQNSTEVAEDCFEIVPTPEPKEPQIDLQKACESARETADGQWTVDCTLTITGQNLPNGYQFRVTDELMSSNTQTASFGMLTAQSNSCGGAPIPGGTMAGCDLTTDMLNAAGGTLTIPYTGTYQGSGGRPLTGPVAQNCAYVDVPGLGLHGPQGGNGKSCVRMDFKLEATSTGGYPLIEPDTPAGPGGVVIGTPAEMIGDLGLTEQVEPQEPSVTKTCDPLVFATGASTAVANCTITITIPANSGRQVTMIEDYVRIGSLNYTDIVVGPMPPLTGLPALGCTPDLTSVFPAHTKCTGPSLAQITAGGVFTFNWTAEMERPQAFGPRHINCVVVRSVVTATNGPADLYDCERIEYSFEEDRAASTPAPVPEAAPKLTVRKSQTSDCVPNRSTQRYSCGFRITVTNEGNAPFAGPMVVTDTFGSPFAQAITLTSNSGWTCAQPVGGAVSCEHSGLTLAPGGFSYIDLDMQVQGLVNGGRWENCAATGVPAEPRQRVAAIQQAMNARGLEAGPVDGLPGTKTYTALAQLQRSLGLPQSREFDDALVRALGLPLVTPGDKACVTADLPSMPRPPLQCDRATTVSKGEDCACRFDNMVRRNATACQCQQGYVLETGRGCVRAVVPPAPPPTPTPVPPPLEEVRRCDPNSTRLRGDQCVCIDQRNAVKTSETTCGCQNGLPMIAGLCIPVEAAPRPEGDGPAGPAGGEGNGSTCMVELNGICLKYN